MTPRPELTVVIACVEARATIGDCLRSFGDALAPIDGEIILCHREGDEPDLPDDVPQVRRIAVSGDALVPHLWGAGLRAARGDAVGFSTGHFLVGPAWATALLEALRSGWAGAGGPIALASGATLLDRAIHLVRYSSFSPPVTEGPSVEIPGDNAAYRREWLALYPEAFESGFWEVEFHERVRARGGRLALVSGAEARYGRSCRLPAFLRQRYRHGKVFGAFRIERGGSKLRLALVAPGVPLALTRRILRREASGGGSLARAASAVPLVLMMTTAWAIGEAVGAVGARGAGTGSGSETRKWRRGQR